MKEQFIPYEDAMALKALGFNEKCFAMYRYNKSLRIGKIGEPLEYVKNSYGAGKKCDGIAAPLWQQAFEWIKKEYGISINNTSNITSLKNLINNI